MICPSCDSSLSKVVTTTTAISRKNKQPKWFTDFAVHYPSIVWRHRRCKDCGNKWSTLELPLSDIKAIGKPEQIAELTGGKAR